MSNERGGQVPGRKAATVIERHRVPADGGVELQTIVVRPDGSARVPAVYHATPYGAERFVDEARQRAESGLAVVTQDVRGRFGSTGDFDLGRRAGLDGACTIAWIREQPWCDGRVLGVGVSFGGYTALAAADPQLLDSVAPVMAPNPWHGLSFRGPGGAVRLALLTHWLVRQAATDPSASPELTHTLLGEAFEHHQVLSAYDGYAAVNPDLAARHPVVGRLPLNPSASLDQLPLWTEMWRRAWDPPRRPEPETDVEIPVAVVVGFYDIFIRDSVDTFARSPHPDSRLVLVPTGHGFHLLQHPVPSPGYRYWLGVEHIWARERLLGSGNDLSHSPRVTYWMFDADEWRTADAWPPKEAEEQVWHLHPGAGRPHGTMSTSPADSDAPPVRFDVDPRSPYPTSGGATLGFPPGPVPVVGLSAAERPDVVSFTTEPLSQPVEFVGHIRVAVWVTADVPDIDLAAVLVLDDGGGRPLAIASGLTRARYRDEDAAQRAPSEGCLREPVEIVVDLGHLAWRVPEGTRLRLDLCGSDFPRYDRNLHTGGPEGSETLLAARIATIGIHAGPELPSRLIWASLPAGDVASTLVREVPA